MYNIDILNKLTNPKNMKAFSIRTSVRELATSVKVVELMQELGRYDTKAMVELTDDFRAGKISKDEYIRFMGREIGFWKDREASAKEVF